MQTIEDIELYEQWWIEKSRKNFLAYRMYLNDKKFLQNWFVVDLCRNLQQFYVDFVDNKRPILIIHTPPQHGKSWAVWDFVTWAIGQKNSLRVIYASYSDTLGVKCNQNTNRCLSREKYHNIFPDTRMSPKRGVGSRTLKQIELFDSDQKDTGGQFRNTTVAGRITGESLDIGIIDDAVKGAEQSVSVTWSNKIWDWYCLDYSTRFADNAGQILIMTRWATHDIAGRIIEQAKEDGRTVTNIVYTALAEDDEKHRKKDEPLFPQLKSKEFLLRQQKLLGSLKWASVYQGNPVVDGGNKFKEKWWQWWSALPPLAYKFITADTSQKTEDQNDFSVFQCWGVGRHDGRIYLLDKLRDKWEAPELRRIAEIFYNKHNTKRSKVDDPILRGMFIEDKSSGTGLLQELRRNRLRVHEVPRNRDKNIRADDAAPFVEAGNVVLNTNITEIDNLLKEAAEFPNGEFDDDIDTLMTAIEVTYINKEVSNSLAAAMAADN